MLGNPGDRVRPRFPGLSQKTRSMNPTKYNHWWFAGESSDNPRWLDGAPCNPRVSMRILSFSFTDTWVGTFSRRECHLCRYNHIHLYIYIYMYIYIYVYIYTVYGLLILLHLWIWPWVKTQSVSCCSHSSRYKLDVHPKKTCGQIIVFDPSPIFCWFAYHLFNPIPVDEITHIPKVITTFFLPICPPSALPSGPTGVRSLTTDALKTEAIPRQLHLKDPPNGPTINWQLSG